MRRVGNVLTSKFASSTSASNFSASVSTSFCCRTGARDTADTAIHRPTRVPPTMPMNQRTSLTGGTATICVVATPKPRFSYYERRATELLQRECHEHEKDAHRRLHLNACDSRPRRAREPKASRSRHLHGHGIRVRDQHLAR